jgi:hypothetical protein
MLVIMELLHGTWGGAKRKKNDRASTILKCITSVQVE